MFQQTIFSRLICFPKLFLFAVCIFTFTYSAYPCKCIKGSLKNYYKNANAVAMIEVIDSVSKTDNTSEVTLKVLNAWKTDLPEVLTIMVEKTSCEYELIKGEKHLLYLEKLESGIFTTSQCRGNVSKNQSNPAIRWLKYRAKKGQIT